MQHPTAPLEPAMSQPLPPRRPWYHTTEQWDAMQAAQAAQAGQVPNPNVPLPGVPPQIWAAMSPAEQAKLYADRANAEAVVQSQQRASQSTKNTLIVIFVLIPVLILLLILVVNALSQTG